MNKLIETWEGRANKFHKLGRICANDIKQEGFLASSETYKLCAAELRRHLTAVEADAKKWCGCYRPPEETGGGGICLNCRKRIRTT